MIAGVWGGGRVDPKKTTVKKVRIPFTVSIIFYQRVSVRTGS